MRIMLDRLATPGAVARLAAIVYLKQPRTGAAVADIRADRADYVTEPAPALAQQTTVARRFGQPSAGQPRRYYVTPLLATGELAFDTRHGPFADPRLRPPGLLNVGTGRVIRSGTLAYTGPAGAVGACSGTGCGCVDRPLSARGRDPVGSGLRRATRHAVRLNSARQRRAGGVWSSRRSSILTGWRRPAAESISARVRGQGKIR